MQHKFLKSLSASLMTCLLLGSLSLTSCDTTADSTDKIVLEVFGPTPALRGGDLEFIGMNLNKVTSIEIPGTAPITTITVISPSKIKISIPQDSKPGLVVLKTPQGDITTKTELTFSEPISISGITPLTVKAGDEFTINGDYLHLIAQVIFNDGIVIDSADFTSQTRYQIKVAVPIQAQSGKVILSNGAEIPIMIYSDTTIAVTLPTLATLTPNPVKPGTALTVTGTDFQLVKAVIFADGIIDSVFTAKTNTSMTVTVPAATKEGRFKLLTYSKVEVTSAIDLNLVSPVISSIAPNPVKTGSDLTITGTNLDLATSVVFGGGGTGTIVSQSATSIVVTPPTAGVDGTVTLNTNSGKSVVSDNLTFVKPVISSVAPLALTAGDNITITGTDLDLVKQVKFKEGLVVNVTPTSATSLTVATPDAAVSGTFTLVALNGAQVTSSDALTLSSANKPVILTLPAAVKKGTSMTITGKKLHLVEKIVFADGTKVTEYGARTSTMIEFTVPTTTAKGSTTLKLTAFDATEVVSSAFNVLTTDPITSLTKMVYDCEINPTTYHAPDWDGWGGSYDAATAKADGFITINVAQPGWWIFGCNHLTWPVVNPANYVLKVDIKATTPIKVTGTYEFIFRVGDQNVSARLIEDGDYIKTKDNDWETLVIPIDAAFTGAINASGTSGIILNAKPGDMDFKGLCFDNMRFDPK